MLDGLLRDSSYRWLAQKHHGISVEVDASEDRVPGVGRQEAREVGVVVAGMEVLQAVRRAIDPLDRLLTRLTWVEALVDVGLAVDHGGAVGGERGAKGAVVMDAGRYRPHERDPAAGGEVVLVRP